MTRVIEIGKRGQIVIYLEDGKIVVNNATSCPLVVDGGLVQPGEVV